MSTQDQTQAQQALAGLKAKTEAPKPEAKTEAPKPEAKTEAPKPEAKTEAPKTEAPKPEETKETKETHKQAIQASEQAILSKLKASKKVQSVKALNTWCKGFNAAKQDLNKAQEGALLYLKNEGVKNASKIKLPSLLSYPRLDDHELYNIKIANTFVNGMTTISQFSMGDDKSTYGATFIALPLSFKTEGKAVTKQANTEDQDKMLYYALEGKLCEFKLLACQLVLDQCRRQARAGNGSKSNVKVYTVGTSIRFKDNICLETRSLMLGIDASKPLTIKEIKQVGASQLYVCTGKTDKNKNKKVIIDPKEVRPID